VVDPVKRLSFIANLLPADQLALSDGEQSLTYLELIRQIQLCQQWLDSLDGQILAFQLENSLSWVILDLAAQGLNKTLIPIPAFFSATQLEQTLNSAGADLFLADHSLDENPSAARWINTVGREKFSGFMGIRVWQLPAGQRPMLPPGTTKITFTSGSTGSPKGVCLDADIPWRVAQSLADTLDIRHPRHLCLLPLTTLLENIAGLYSPLLAGGTVLIPSDQRRGLSGSSGLDVPAMLQAIGDFQPETLILIPQMLLVLVHAAQQGWPVPSSLKFMAVGGGKVARKLILQARQLGLPVYQGYGLSECGSVVALNTPGNDRADSVGAVLPHCRIKEIDGQLVVAGASHLGYLGQPDSWFPASIETGDLGHVEQGFVHIDGRQKNILISSFGRNISPEWVESELMAQPLLSQALVVGDARPFLVALLSAPPSVPDIAITHWVAQVNATLPDYARIERWQRLETSDFSPFMTANGRIQRAAIEQDRAELIESLYQDAYPQPANLPRFAHEFL